MELLSDGGYGDSGEGLPPSYERSFAHSDAAGGITRDEKGGAQPQAYGMIAHDAGGDGDFPSWMDTSVEDMFAAADNIECKCKHAKACELSRWLLLFSAVSIWTKNNRPAAAHPWVSSS